MQPKIMYTETMRNMYDFPSLPHSLQFAHEQAKSHVVAFVNPTKQLPFQVIVFPKICSILFLTVS